MTKIKAYVLAMLKCLGPLRFVDLLQCFRDVTPDKVGDALTQLLETKCVELVRYEYTLTAHGGDELAAMRREKKSNWVFNVRAGMDSNGRQTKVTRAVIPNPTKVRVNTVEDELINMIDTIDRWLNEY